MSEFTKRIRRAASVLATGRDRALDDAYRLGQLDERRGHFDTLAGLKEEDIPGLVDALKCIMAGAQAERENNGGGER